LAHDDGYVAVGTSHDTPTFAVAAIRRWWLAVGRHRYAEAQRLLIEADSGGAHHQPQGGGEGGGAAIGGEKGGVITPTPPPPGAPVPAGGVEVDPDRSSDVQPHQRQLGGGAVDQLRDGFEVHPGHSVQRGFPLPSQSRPEAVRGPTPSLSRGKGARAAAAPEDS